MPTWTVIGAAISIVALGSTTGGSAGDCDLPCPPGAIREGETCGNDTNRGCYGTPPGGSNCCTPNGTIACDNVPCLDLVCEIDSFCCSVAWDQICADEAMKKCPELCLQLWPQSWTPIAVGQAICGSLWTGPVLLDDSDWYALVLDAVTAVTVTIDAGPPLTLGIVDNDGVADCSSNLALDPQTHAAACGTGSITACLEPGTHWIVVLPNVDSGLACDSNAATSYVLSVTSNGRDCDVPDPINDACANAIPIDLGATTIATKWAGTETFEAGPTCNGIDSPTFNDVWFTFSAPRSGRMRLSMCAAVDFNARMVVYTGTCGALELAGCDDVWWLCAWFDPQIDLDVVAGESYLIRVGGESVSQAGSATLTVSYLPCAAAYDIAFVTPDSLVTSLAQGVSNDGEVVGTWSTNTSGLNSFSFRWTEAGGYQPLPTAMHSALFDVNSAGLAVGWAKPAGIMTPMSSSGSTLTPLPGIGGCTGGRANAVNESGAIVGYLTSASCGVAPARWTGGIAELLAVPSQADHAIDINTLGAILGDGALDGRIHGWVLSGDKFEWIASPIPGLNVTPHAINAAEQVALDIVLTSAPLLTKGAMWQDGRFTIIEPPAPFVGSNAIDMNHAGVIVGELATGGSSRSPYVRKGNVIVELNSRIDSRAGLNLDLVRAIGDNGVIVGGVGSASQSFGLRLKPIPPTGDLDCNAVVDAADLAELLGAWGACTANTSCAADFNVDGVVDAADLAIMLGGWGPVLVH